MLKKFLAIILSICIFFNEAAVVKAETFTSSGSEKNDLSWDVIEATTLLESVFTCQMENIRLQLEEKLENGDYDYSLTMESFGRLNNPLNGYDNMNGLIAALCMITCKTDTYITDVVLIEPTFIEKSMQRTISEKVPYFKEFAPGKFVQDGYTYITTEQVIDTYTDEDNDGVYKKSGTRSVTPKKEDVKYLATSYHVPSPINLLKKYGLSEKKIIKEYNKRLELIKNGGQTDEGLSESVFINLAKYESILPDDAFSYLEKIQKNGLSTTQNRKELFNTAISLIGRVPYLWGGKSKCSGYDSYWWSFNENGQQNGLDCSGYIQWIYRTAGYSKETYEKIGSTAATLKNCCRIRKIDLQIGDLGLLHEDNGAVNHVGMYIGNGYFIHCSSSAGTVTIGKGDEIGFKIFARVDNIEKEKIEGYKEKNTYAAKTLDISEADIYLIAQTVYNEVAGEGLNAWIAVAEVIKNRIQSDQFPNNAKDVIYAKGQFADNDLIETRVPSEQMIEAVRLTMNGTLSVLKNDRVYFFRVPKESVTTDWGPFPFYTKIGITHFYLGKS